MKDLLTPLLFLRSLSNMLTLLLAATKSCELTFEKEKGQIYKQPSEKMDEKGKGTDHKSDRFPPSSVPILALLPLLLTTSIHLKCNVSFFFHFLFETFLAPPFAAAACSLERMMLFCQTEPALEALLASSSSDSSFCENNI